ncbi:hypothetical protein [Neobacillus vireti]|uniref:hypothetical protein n=1 Tax=Neobacillus vireti TaxID=220686 RepID=UPI002FFEC078
MIADLLTRLEEEKDQWMYEAIARFHETILLVDGQKYTFTTGETPENQLIQIRNLEHSLWKQKSHDLEQMEKEMLSIKESINKDQQDLENLASTLDDLQNELAVYEEKQKGLEGIQLEKFTCYLHHEFNFDKKDQVVFKERKISRLMESYQNVEMDILDFYQRQLSSIWLVLTRSMENLPSTAKFDFNTQPPRTVLSLKHGRGLDQYIKPGNFEEDYKIVLDTLERNNAMVYDYYESQVNQFVQDSTDEITRLRTLANEQQRSANENILELQEKKRKKEARMIELQDRLSNAKQEWEQDSMRPQLLDDLLKEEFVKAVSGWQEKLLAENASDEERWVYHHYCQIILKQAEGIFENE